MDIFRTQLRASVFGLECRNGSFLCLDFSGNLGSRLLSRQNFGSRNSDVLVVQKS